MYFCSNERLIIKNTDGIISCTNPYTNQKFELSDNVSGEFCTKNISGKLFVMYGNSDGNLYEATYNGEKFNTECVLERKNGEGTAHPYGIILYDETKYYLYGIKNNEQELLALQKFDDIPETVASGKNILFDYRKIGSKLYFCFNDADRIVIKIYDMDLKKWSSSQIVKYDFEMVTGIKALEKDNKLMVAVLGKVCNNFTKTIVYTYENETTVSEYDTKGEELSLIQSFDNGFVVKNSENYILMCFNGVIKEYSINEHFLCRILFAERQIASFINNKSKIKRELEYYVFKNKSYEKLKNKIRYVKKELSYNEKDLAKITKEIYGDF